MLMIDTNKVYDYTKELKWRSTSHSKSKDDSHSTYDKHRLLAGGASSSATSTVSTIDMLNHEKLTFEIVKWVHLFTFIMIMVHKALSHYGLKNLSMLVQALFCNLMGIFFHPYVIFIIKSSVHTWTDETEKAKVTYVRIWLLAETVYFFSWLFSIMVFMFGTYVFKFQPTAIDEELQLQDNNVWNDKNTMDALEFLELEVFTFCFILANLVVGVLIGFTPVADIDSFGKSNLMS